MSDTQDYLNLVTSEHAEQPKFMAMLTCVVSPLVQIQSLLDSFNKIFDLDLPPVGNQLDIIGEWVGVSRNVEIPIPGVFFGWDQDFSTGWEYGIWQDPTQTSAISVLPDDVYYSLIKAKIAANHWDGTTEGLYSIWSIIFPTINLLIQDDQNMSYRVAVQGQIIDSLSLALLRNGSFLLRPEGIQITEYIVPVNENKLFSWDIQNNYVDGWDLGSWGRELAPV
jgi:hypothetical protein